MKKATPYISFIGFARNDTYTPNRTERHNFSLNFLIKQLEEYKIPSEIIIVEWNYPEDRPPLADAIKIENTTEWTTLRVIRVPAHYHQKYTFWECKSFHVGAALNVGVRRASGKFILPIASDVFLTDSCLEAIARQNLDEDTFYRCNRYDVDSSVLETQKSANRGDFFKSCESHIKVHHKKIIQEPSFKIADLHTNACGDFLLASRERVHQIHGYKEGGDTGALDIDSLVVHALHGLGCKEKILSEDCRVYKLFHLQSTSRAVRQRFKLWQKIFERFLLEIGCPTFIINNSRILFNYPKREYQYAPGAIFDSFETNFIKPARAWAKKIPPFYLNNGTWGLLDQDLKEVTIDLRDLMRVE